LGIDDKIAEIALRTCSASGLLSVVSIKHTRALQTGSKFPANREKYREICKKVGAFAGQARPNALNSGKSRQIRCVTKQGIFD
jgi:hypothetical protein